MAAVNRPGPGGAWQRHRERTVLGRADLLLPWSEAAAEAARRRWASVSRALVLPPPVPVGATPAAGCARRAGLRRPTRQARPRRALRGLGARCARGRRAGRRRPRPRRGPALAAQARWLGARRGRWLGAVERPRWLALVAGARVFLSAARIEDWGMAQMEALAAGTPLVLRARAGRQRGAGAGPRAGARAGGRPSAPPRPGPRAVGGAVAGRPRARRLRPARPRAAGALLGGGGSGAAWPTSCCRACWAARRRSRSSDRTPPRRSSGRGRRAAIAAAVEVACGGRADARRPGAAASPAAPARRTRASSISGTPPTRVATAGSPLAMASISTHRQVLGQAGQHEQVGRAHQPRHPLLGLLAEEASRGRTGPAQPPGPRGRPQLAVTDDVQVRRRAVRWASPPAGTGDPSSRPAPPR